MEKNSKLKYIEIVFLVCILSLGIFLIVDGIFTKEEKIHNVAIKEKQDQRTQIVNDDSKQKKEDQKENEENIKYDLLNVEASSTLANQGSNTYGASNLVDHNSTTCWSEGASGAGIGEYVTFNYSGAVALKSITISNGYRKSEELFYKNHRLKEAKIVFDDGYSQLLELSDGFNNSVQTFDLDTNHKTKTVKIYIEDVYTGNKYDDTTIDEINIELK